MPAFDPYNRHCPSRQMLDQIGDRWTVLIVGSLANGPLRHAGIVERVDGISQKMLAQTLRRLERDGLITRTAYAEMPPRVEYDLTDAGHSLLAPLGALEDWAKAHMSTVLATRELYDETHPAPAGLERISS
ncbi:MAG: winged helix-turn-helix transcriptional regulator [Rhodoglobus sp.]